MSLYKPLLCSVLIHFAIFWAFEYVSTFKTAPAKLTGQSIRLLVKLNPASTISKSKTIIAINDSAKASHKTIAIASPPTNNNAASQIGWTSPLPILEKNGIPEYGLLPSTPYYYPVSEVNRKPAVVENINALAPELLELRVTGSAIVSLYINDFGSIDKVEIEESDFNFAARAAIIKEFGKMIFTPASKDNIQVHSKMRIEVMLQNTPAQLVDDPNQPPIPFW